VLIASIWATTTTTETPGKQKQIGLQAASFLSTSLRSYTSIDGIGSAGGIFSAWDQLVFSLANTTRSDHILSIDCTQIWISNVYAPYEHADKEAFLLSLGSRDPNDIIHWIIYGDFNLCRDYSDKNNTNYNHNEATMFNDCINDLCLTELPLRDHRYTWSNRRDNPTRVRLDRFFINNSWNTTFPSSALSSVTRDTSDHVPIVATISSAIPRSNIF
jgi:exonuclease III